MLLDATFPQHQSERQESKEGTKTFVRDKETFVRDKESGKTWMRDHTQSVYKGVGRTYTWQIDMFDRQGIYTSHIATVPNANQMCMHMCMYTGRVPWVCTANQMCMHVCVYGVCTMRTNHSEPEQL